MGVPMCQNMCVSKSRGVHKLKLEDKILNKEKHFPYFLVEEKHFSHIIA